MSVCKCVCVSVCECVCVWVGVGVGVGWSIQERIPPSLYSTIVSVYVCMGRVGFGGKGREKNDVNCVVNSPLLKPSFGRPNKVLKMYEPSVPP